MVLYPNKLPESERVCFGICNAAADRRQLLPHQERGQADCRRRN